VATATYSTHPEGHIDPSEALTYAPYLGAWGMLSQWRNRPRVQLWVLAVHLERPTGARRRRAVARAPSANEVHERDN